MYCPSCNRILRINREDKRVAEEEGKIAKRCSTCGFITEIPYEMIFDTSKYHKELREIRKSAGLCTDCGARPALPNHTVCDVCNAKRRKYAEGTKSIRYDEVRPVKKKKAMTMDEIVAAAYKEGLSYGQYVAKYGV